MRRVIFTTIQYYPEALKMLELTLKSFFVFNKDFDYKVFCLDNSKDKFKEYFKDSKRSKYIDLERLEFINFKDGTKWNNYLTHIENDELTELEKKNFCISDDALYSFNINLTISKLEIIDLLLEKYDLVIASDIDIVFVNSIETPLKGFLNSGKFLGSTWEERGACKFYSNAGFWVFDKSKREVKNIFDNCISLINTDLIYKTFGRPLKYIEQDLLSILLNSKYEIPEIYCPIFHADFRPFENACLIHYAGKEYKYFIGEICNKNLRILNFTLTLRYCKEFYQKVADLLDVKIQTKFLNIFQRQNVALKKRIIKTLETHLLRIKQKLKEI